MRGNIAFIRSFHHVRLTVPQVVTTLNMMVPSVVRQLRSSLFHSAWMYTCLRTCLSTCNSTIILFFMVVQSLKPLLILFFKTVLFSCTSTDLLYRYCLLVFILIPYISIIFLYSYRFSVLVLFSDIEIYDIDIYYTYYLTCYYLTPDSCLLSLDTCLLSPDTYLISLITYHLISLDL